ncbi:MAG: nucleotide-binding protein, partial [Christensenellaceae bacterium]|nr:nucleotide-binding protein [Christensenellaceae bacterium]
EITSRYDSIISGFGNGLYNYYADQHFYDPEICGDSLLHNLRVLHEKMVAYQAKKYSPVATVNNSLKHSESDVKDNKKVFVVHGHDNEAKQELSFFKSAEATETYVTLNMERKYKNLVARQAHVTVANRAFC